MATVNPFDLLGDDDIEDPSQLIAAQQQKVPAQAKKAPAPATSHQQPAKLPSKPSPPVKAAREAKVGGEHGGGYVHGRGGNTNTENAYGSRDFSGSRSTIDDRDSSNPSERRGSIDGPRTSVRGGSRGRFNNGKGSDGEQTRRAFECRSGTGHGNEMKREGAGRGN